MTNKSRLYEDAKRKLIAAGIRQPRHKEIRAAMRTIHTCGGGRAGTRAALRSS